MIIIIQRHCNDGDDDNNHSNININNANNNKRMIKLFQEYNYSFSCVVRRQSSVVEVQLFISLIHNSYFY